MLYYANSINMSKTAKIIIFCAIIFCAVFGFSKVTWSATQINAYFFWGDGCPHCEKEKDFLDYMATKYRALKINDFEIYNNGSNSKILKQSAGLLGARVDGVPALIIGDQFFIGYAEFTTPIQIENRIKECLMMECSDSIANIVAQTNNFSEDKNSNNNEDEKTLLGKITKTPGGLVALFIIAVLAVGLVAYQVKK
jgi:glutaredoxin